MRIQRFDFRLKYPPRPDALLLEARKSPHVWSVCDGLNVTAYDLHDRVIILRPRYLFALIWYSLRTTRMAAMLCARVRSQKIQVVFGLENHDKFNYLDPNHPLRNWRTDTSKTLFDDVSAMIPELRLFSIQHGQELRRFPKNRPKKNVTLLCWGQWTANNFSSFGRNESKFLPVGPLIDGLYREIRPATIEKTYPVCLVSTVKGKDWWGDTVGERRGGYEVLVSYLAKFAASRAIPIHVALTIDRDQYGDGDADAERKWFLDRLGPSIQFTEPSVISGDPNVVLAGRREPRYVKERYATYFLCDRSQITLGMTSSVLWESFGRGNKVLAVNLTDNPVYDFPIAGPWSMGRPTYDEFEARLSSLLAMSDSEWTALSAAARRELITFDSEDPPHHKIRRLLADAIRCGT